MRGRGNDDEERDRRETRTVQLLPGTSTVLFWSLYRHIECWGTGAKGDGLVSGFRVCSGTD
jgi:hypothetical protein